jgi:hypothetical protein
MGVEIEVHKKLACIGQGNNNENRNREEIMEDDFWGWVGVVCFFLLVVLPGTLSCIYAAYGDRTFNMILGYGLIISTVALAIFCICFVIYCFFSTIWG